MWAEGGIQLVLAEELKDLRCSCGSIHGGHAVVQQKQGVVAAVIWIGAKFFELDADVIYRCFSVVDVVTSTLERWN